MGKESDLIGEIQRDTGLVLRELTETFSGIKDFEIQGSHVDRAVRSVLKTLMRFYYKFTIPDKQERAAGFIVKYWEPVEGDVPKILRMDNRGRDREYQTYEFFAGLPYVPKAYLIETILRERGLPKEKIVELMKKMSVLPSSLILEDVGTDTLDMRLRAKEQSAERQQCIETILSSVIDFEIAATNRDAEKRGFSSLFSERTMAERILDYMGFMARYNNRCFPDKLRRKTAADYAPVAKDYQIDRKNGKFVHLPMVCHGDLNTGNIIFNKSNELHFIDFKPKKNYPPSVDLACLLSSPGVRLSRAEREDLANKFGEILLGKAHMQLDEDVGRVTMRSFYNGMLHNSARNIAIIMAVKMYFPERYRYDAEADLAEMQTNILESLGRLTASGDELGLTAEELNCYSGLKDDFYSVGMFKRTPRNHARRNEDQYSEAREPAQVK